MSANTHKYITTGLEENKFGINQWELDLLSKIENAEKYPPGRPAFSYWFTDHRPGCI
ncbi:MAG: hypothetical protein U0Z17_08490 [Bacteroidales bacterium]